jgi:putative ABC transport system permease protein
MSSTALLGSLELGLLMGLLALAVFLSFRVLNFPDLTVDGSFPLGAAVCAALIAAGGNPYLATAAGALAGAAAGALTAYLNVRLRILHLLAGILVMVGLYSINLRVMNAPNIPLIGLPTVVSGLEAAGLQPRYALPALFLAIAAVAAALLVWFLSTETGLAMRATGENPRMAAANGIHTGRLTIAGLAISNALAGLCGALFAQSQGSADAAMGSGMIVIGLASVIIGENLVPSRLVALAVVGAIAGSVVYRLVIGFALSGNVVGLQAQDLNLVTAVLVGVALVLPRMRAAIRARGAARASLGRVA